jgi:hypothetical protein
MVEMIRDIIWITITILSGAIVMAISYQLINKNRPDSESSWVKWLYLGVGYLFWLAGIGIMGWSIWYISAPH